MIIFILLWMELLCVWKFDYHEYDIGENYFLSFKKLRRVYGVTFHFFDVMAFRGNG